MKPFLATWIWSTNIRQVPRLQRGKIEELAIKHIRTLNGCEVSLIY